MRALYTPYRSQRSTTPTTAFQLVKQEKYHVGVYSHLDFTIISADAHCQEGNGQIAKIISIPIVLFIFGCSKSSPAVCAGRLQSAIHWDRETGQVTRLSLSHLSGYGQYTRRYRQSQP